MRWNVRESIQHFSKVERSGSYHHRLSKRQENALIPYENFLFENTNFYDDSAPPVGIVLLIEVEG